MSIRLMSQVWEIELSHSKQSVLLAMADVADDDGGRCYPSHPYLAWKTGYSERQIARIINELIDDGVVEVVKLGTNNHPPYYRIHIEKGKPKEPYEAVRLRSKENGGDNLSPQEIVGGDNLSSLGATNATVGATNATSGGDKLSPDPLVNHYREPLKEPLTESNGNAVVAAGAAAPPFDLKQHPAVKAYHDFHRRYPDHGQMKLIAERDPPLAAWVRAIRAWSGRGHNRTNIEGQLEWAFDPSRFEDRARANDDAPSANDGRKTGYGAYSTQLELGAIDP